MHDPPTSDPELLEAMEVCRPGIDDPADPLMASVLRQVEGNPQAAELYRRIQEADRAIGVAFRAVPVPEGLAERLLARLGAGDAERSGPEGAASATATELPSSPTPSPQAALPEKLGRRRWLAIGLVGAAVASAAAVLLAIWVAGAKPEPLTPSRVHQLAAEQFFSEAEQFGSGPLLAVQPPPPGFPLSQDVTVRRAEVRWRWARLADRKALAYDIRLLREGQCASLYVLQAVVGQLPDRAPGRPTLSTSDCSIAAWQEGPLLYVLVVHGSPRTYQRFLAPVGPLT